MPRRIDERPPDTSPETPHDFGWPPGRANWRFARMSDDEDACRRNPPCPWLPEAREIHDFTITRRHGRDRGPAFYQDALGYAQSQWISCKPAQAILQLNKAWMADLRGAEAVLENFPPPYRALVWILWRCTAADCGYLGNPVRHFQHLASRMSGPRAEIRSWRAWLCMHLAERVLPHGLHPRDGCQIAREGLSIPGFGRALNAVKSGGWPEESRFAMDAMSDPGVDNPGFAKISRNPQGSPGFNGS